MRQSGLISLCQLFGFVKVICVIHAGLTQIDEDSRDKHCILATDIACIVLLHT